jgi:hypothetical protein
MKKRWSLAALVVLAGVLAVTVALSPSAALAKEFKFAGPPAFTVTYPDAWSQAAENPNKVLIRLQLAGGLPTTEIQCMDAPKGETVATLGQWQKKRIARVYDTAVTVTSDKQATLKDGTPCDEVLLDWMYQGFLNLQTACVTVLKGGKVIYVTVSQNPGSVVEWGPGRSITFK